jgi:hypothetical protein
MKTLSKIAVLVVCVVSVFLLELQLPPEAQAVYGTRRRTARRTAVVVSSASHAQTAQAQAEAAAAPTAPPPQAGSLPLGTVAQALPAGCTPMSIGDVEYQHCGSNYYRTAFQGSQLVYVTVQP